MKRSEVLKMAALVPIAAVAAVQLPALAKPVIQSITHNVAMKGMESEWSVILGGFGVTPEFIVGARLSGPPDLGVPDLRVVGARANDDGTVLAYVVKA